MSNEKTQKLYGESEMIKAARYGYEYHQNSQFPSLKFDEMAVNNFKQLLLSNQLQEEEVGVTHFHMGDIMTNDLELDYPNYYVRVEDYVSMKSALTTVTAERDRMKSEADKLRDSLTKAVNHIFRVGYLYDTPEKQIDYIIQPYTEALQNYAAFNEAISQSEKGEIGNG